MVKFTPVQLGAMEASFPQTIAWRDTRITLLGVSNAGLRYRVEGGQ